MKTKSAHLKDILCVVEVHAGGHTWTPSMEEWRRSYDDYKAKKVKNLFGFLARPPKQPADAREDYPDQSWFDTVVLNAAAIPAILKTVAEFEKDAKDFIAPRPGWRATSEIQRVLYIGRPEQFCDAIPPRQLLPRMGMPWPETLVDRAVTGAAIKRAMESFNPPARKKPPGKTPRSQAKLDAMVQQAVVAQAPIKLLKPLGLKK